MNIRNFWKKFSKRSIRTEILGAFLSLIFLSSLIIITYTYHRDSLMILDFARQFMQQISTVAINETNTYLDEAARVTEVGSSSVDSRNDVSMHNKDLINFMFSVLRYHDHISNYYVGMSDGSFLMVTQLPAKFKNVQEKVPRGAKFRLRYINRSTRPVIDTWIYYDEFGKILERRRYENPDYDPRDRPWYVIARKEEKNLSSPLKIYGGSGVDWTKIYSFTLLKEQGITASDAVYDSNGKFIGVFGADLSLKGISNFLEEQKIGKTGLEIIITDKGKIISSPDFGHEVERLGDEDLTVYNITHKLFAAAFDRYTAVKENNFIFQDENGEKYLASITKFPKQYKEPWLILITVPLNDFFGEIIHTHLHTLFISFAVLVIAALAGIFLSRRLSNPIVKLSTEIDEIKNFNLDRTIDIHTNIKELDQISQATMSMQKALKSFGYFVPKELVKKMMTHNVDLGLGGIRKNLTIFFSDVCDFTAISENVDPEKMMLYLSEYLDEISKVILAQRGTIDKYIGDNVMAFWGAPEDDAEDAYHACHSALLCQKRINEMNAKWKNEGKPEFLTRIGIHKDDVIVGNIGTHERRNYTIIGDGVNLASRLEYLNKYYGTKIIISEILQQIVGSRFLTRSIDIVAVKGKKKKTKIYELVGEYDEPELAPSDKEKEFCLKFNEAFELYLQRKWNQSCAIFEELYKQEDKGKVCEVYIKRCKEFLQHPPSSDWEGVSKML